LVLSNISEFSWRVGHNEELSVLLAGYYQSEMGGAYRTNGREQKLTRGFIRKTLNERASWKT
jgi:hypothetical protein